MIIIELNKPESRGIQSFDELPPLGIICYTAFGKKTIKPYTEKGEPSPQITASEVVCVNGNSVAELFIESKRSVNEVNVLFYTRKISEASQWLESEGGKKMTNPITKQNVGKLREIAALMLDFEHLPERFYPAVVDVYLGHTSESYCYMICLDASHESLGLDPEEEEIQCLSFESDIWKKNRIEAAAKIKGWLDWFDEDNKDAGKPDYAKIDELRAEQPDHIAGVSKKVPALDQKGSKFYLKGKIEDLEKENERLKAKVERQRSQLAANQVNSNAKVRVGILEEENKRLKSELDEIKETLKEDAGKIEFYDPRGTDKVIYDLWDDRGGSGVAEVADYVKYLESELEEANRKLAEFDGIEPPRYKFRDIVVNIYGEVCVVDSRQFQQNSWWYRLNKDGVKQEGLFCESKIYFPKEYIKLVDQKAAELEALEVGS